MKVFISQNPLVKHYLSILRNKNTSYPVFRNTMKKISYALAFDVFSKIELSDVEVETPLEKTDGFKIKNKVVLVPILRAGLGMLEPFVDLIPESSVGMIGVYRNEETLEPVPYYFKVPSGDFTVILDPMLATGGTVAYAVEELQKRNHKNIKIASVISAPEGLKKLEPYDVEVFTASVDRQLNDVGYILPGLGDAGDRTFGTEDI